MVGNEREYFLEKLVFYDILNFEAVFVNYKGIFLPFFKSQTINYRNIKIIKNNCYEVCRYESYLHVFSETGWMCV